MGAPTTSVLDDFNRADGAAGSNWSSPSFQIASNRLTAPTGAYSGSSSYQAYGAAQR